MDNSSNTSRDHFRVILNQFEERTVEQLYAVENSLNTVSYDVSRRFQIVYEQLDDIRRAIRSLSHLTQSTNQVSSDTFELADEHVKLEETERPKDDLAEIWNSALKLIRARIGTRSAYQTWFGETSIERINAENHTAIIKVKTPFVRQWLEGHYKALVEQALSIVSNQELQVNFVTEYKPHL